MSNLDIVWALQNSNIAGKEMGDELSEEGFSLGTNKLENTKPFLVFRAELWKRTEMVDRVI